MLSRLPINQLSILYNLHKMLQLILRTAEEEECRLNTENMLLNRPLIRTVFGVGVLQNSSLFSDFKIVKNLLSTKNIDGKTALDLAVEYNRLEVIVQIQKLLLLSFFYLLVIYLS